MSKKKFVMIIFVVILVYLVFVSIQTIRQGSPEITYEILKFEELPEDILIRLDTLNFNPFEDNGANSTFSIRTSKDTYIFLKAPKGSTVNVLEVRVDEIWLNTLEYKYTTYGEDGVDIKKAMRIIKINNYLGGVTGIYTSGSN